MEGELVVRRKLKNVHQNVLYIPHWKLNNKAHSSQNTVQRSDFAVGVGQCYSIIKCVGPDFQNKKLAGPAILSVSYSRV